MAGWFYTYYTSQQKDRTQQADPALSSASLRPASTLQSRPATRPAQNSLTDQRTPFSLSGLHMPYEFSFAEQQGNYIRRQKETLRRRMQEQMQQSMMAFQQMRDSSKRGDAWKNIHLSPSMDMSEFSSHYELNYSIPDITSGEVNIALKGRLLSVNVANSAPQHPGTTQPRSFQSRVLLPWNVSSNATLSSQFNEGTLTVSISKPQPTN